MDAVWVRRAALLLTGLLAVGFFAGCIDRVGAGDRQGIEIEERTKAVLRAEDFFPAEPGMRWEYDGWGNEFAQYMREATHRRGERAQIIHVSGAIVAYVYEIAPDRIVLRAFHPEIDDGSVDYLDEEGDLVQVILREPLEEGAQWRTMSRIRARNEVDGAGPLGVSEGAPSEDRPVARYVWETRRIEAVGLSLTTPAGTFRNVIQVRVMPDDGIPSIEHYAPGVGLIRSEYLYDESIISELAAFQIGTSRHHGGRI